MRREAASLSSCCLCRICHCPEDELQTLPESVPQREKSRAPGAGARRMRSSKVWQTPLMASILGPRPSIAAAQGAARAPVKPCQPAEADIAPRARTAGCGQRAYVASCRLLPGGVQPASCRVSAHGVCCGRPAETGTSGWRASHGKRRRANRPEPCRRSSA